MASRAYRLKSDEDAAAGIRRIAEGRTKKALERLEGGDEGDLATAIHGARKDLKKVRGLLRLVRHELGKKTFEVENRRYRDAGRLLSGSRDAEVKLETLTKLRHEFRDLPDEVTEGWAGLLETERDAIAATLRGETNGQIGAASGAIEAGGEAIQSWSLRSDSWALVGPGLAKSYRDGRRQMKRVLAEPSEENVHDWRKRAKDLWYQLRIVHDAWPELLGETVDQTHELTDLLGDHHDLSVLAEDLRSRPELGDPGRVEAAIEKRQGDLLDRALAIGERLYAEKPKAFRRRIKRYWRAWRD
jgi:CHAD domain-containing protein